MMAKSHFWVVCDAVDYIQRCGNPTQKAALQTFQLAYGERGPVDEIASHRTAVAHLVGYEAWHTDKFGDLVISMRTLPCGTRREAVGIGFNMFTAFNHFINPYPETEGPWPDADGYSFNSSSMRGFDSLVVTGISRYLQGFVNVDKSLVLDRIKSRWRGSSAAWEENFKKGLNDTQFAPWNVLASAYYSLLLRHHHEPLEVRGPNSHIVGLQLLGPVAHAVTDCCSVQHVRSTLGFGHSVWENYIKAKVYNRQIKADSDLVGEFLLQEPFVRSSDRLAEGPLKGRFDLEGFLHGLSMRTAHRLEESTRMTWRQLWKAEGKFWRRYLTGSTMRDDAQFLYNMAVAGTVRLIEKSCADLVAEGVVDPNTGLVDPGKMPDIKRIQDEHPEMPAKRRGPEDLPSEDLMSVPLSAPEDLLGFVPIGETHLTDQLRSAEAILAPGKDGRSDARHAAALLKDVEWSLTDQYRRMEHQTGRPFSPLVVRERIPLDSDLSAHFGTGTFRLPSERECDEPELLEQYIDLSDAHAYRAGELELTQRVAALRHLHNQALQAGEKETADTLDRLAGDLENIRATQWDDFSGSFDLLAVGATAEEKKADRVPEAASSKGLMSRLADRISFLFEVPVTALATAAAVAVLLIFVYPRGMPEQVVGLSTEAWEKPHKLKLMGAKKLVPKAQEAFAPAKVPAAVLIQFKYFGDSLNQELINQAYQAVAPTRTMRSKYDVLDPTKMRALLEGEKGPIASAEAVTGKLRANAGVVRMLVVTVEAKGVNVNVTSEVQDFATGLSKVLLSRNNVPRTELASVLRESAKLAFPAD